MSNNGISEEGRAAAYEGLKWMLIWLGLFLGIAIICLGVGSCKYMERKGNALLINAETSFMQAEMDYLSLVKEMSTNVVVEREPQ